MERITDEQLNSICIQLVTDSLHYSPLYCVIYQLIYHTGLRWIEAFNLSRWTLLEDKTYKVDTAKGSNDRIIPYEDVPEFYRLCIASGMKDYDYCRYSSFARSFNKLLPYNPITKGDKEVSTYILRYNKFKILFNDGWKIEDIMVYMGEASQPNAEGYIYAELYRP